MTFMAIVVVFIIVQFAGSVGGLQSDGWYQRWSARTREWTKKSAAALLLQLLVPLFGLWLLLALLDNTSALLLFLFTIPVLIYSLGRGDYARRLQGYVDAAHRNDKTVAADYAQRLGAGLDGTESWPQLHRAVLRRASYRALDRWFAAIFWFVALGPLGAVFYRLTVLSAADGRNAREERYLAHRLLWLLEWPVVRLLGVSLAVTGNFSSCISHCTDTLIDGEMSTEKVLERFVYGSLNPDSRGVSGESVSEEEVEELQSLIGRTLVLWICVLAVMSVL